MNRPGQKHILKPTEISYKAYEDRYFQQSHWEYDTKYPLTFCMHYIMKWKTELLIFEKHKNFILQWILKLSVQRSFSEWIRLVKMHFPFCSLSNWLVQAENNTLVEVAYEKHLSTRVLLSRDSSNFNKSWGFKLLMGNGSFIPDYMIKINWQMNVLDSHWNHWFDPLV